MDEPIDPSHLYVSFVFGNPDPDTYNGYADFAAGFAIAHHIQNLRVPLTNIRFFCNNSHPFKRFQDNFILFQHHKEFYKFSIEEFKNHIEKLDFRKISQVSHNDATLFIIFLNHGNYNTFGLSSEPYSNILKQIFESFNGKYLIIFNDCCNSESIISSVKANYQINKIFPDNIDNATKLGLAILPRFLKTKTEFDDFLLYLNHLQQYPGNHLEILKQHSANLHNMARNETIIPFKQILNSIPFYDAAIQILESGLNLEEIYKNQTLIDIMNAFYQDPATVSYIEKVKIIMNKDFFVLTFILPPNLMIICSSPSEAESNYNNQRIEIENPQLLSSCGMPMVSVFIDQLFFTNGSIDIAHKFIQESSEKYPNEPSPVIFKTDGFVFHSFPLLAPSFHELYENSIVSPPFSLIRPLSIPKQNKHKRNSRSSSGQCSTDYDYYLEEEEEEDIYDENECTDINEYLNHYADNIYLSESRRKEIKMFAFFVKEFKKNLKLKSLPIFYLSYSSDTVQSMASRTLMSSMIAIADQFYRISTIDGFSMYYLVFAHYFQDNIDLFKGIATSFIEATISLRKRFPSSRKGKYSKISEFYFGELDEDIQLLRERINVPLDPILIRPMPKIHLKSQSK